MNELRSALRRLSASLKKNQKAQSKLTKAVKKSLHTKNRLKGK